MLELSSAQKALVPLPAVPARGTWTEGDTRSKNRSEVSSEASPEVELWLGRKKGMADWQKLE